MNTFKSSRFNFLNEEILSSEKNVKNETKIPNRYNNRYDTKESKERREQYEKMLKEKEAKTREEENRKNLAAENFPQLQLNNNVTVVGLDKNPYNISYLDKVSTISIKENTVEEHIKPGWAEGKRDPTNPTKIIYTYGANTSYENENKNKNEKGDRKENRNKCEYEVLEALVNLHNKRTQEYIDMWGYDTWEKMYRFPNYDYHYFDKLDEEYEEQLENEDEMW